MSSSGSTAIKPDSAPKYHVLNLGSNPGSAGSTSGQLSPQRRVERLKGDAVPELPKSVDSLEVKSSSESSVDGEELFHSPPNTQRSCTSATAGDGGEHDIGMHHVRVDDDVLEPHELTFELPQPPSVQSHSQWVGGGGNRRDSAVSEGPSVISGLSAVLNATQMYSLGSREQMQQSQQSRAQAKQSSWEQASGAAATDSPNHQSHVVDMGLYQNMTADQMRAEIRVMAAELAMARQEAEDKVRLQRSLEALEDELHTAKSSKQQVMDELGALKSTVPSQEQLVKARTWFKRRMLRGGGKFVKYSTEGRAQDRWVWMSQDLSKLCWARFKNSLVNTQPSWVAVEEITRVTLGRSTPVTQMVKADENSLLSIHTDSRIIDLGVPVTTSESPTRDQWASLFVWMLENKQRPGDGSLVQQVNNPTYTMLDSSDHPAEHVLQELQSERNELAQQLAVSQSHTPRMLHAEKQVKALQEELAAVKASAAKKEAAVMAEVERAGAAAAAEMNALTEQLASATSSLAQASQAQQSVERQVDELTRQLSTVRKQRTALLEQSEKTNEKLETEAQATQALMSQLAAAKDMEGTLRMQLQELTVHKQQAAERAAADQRQIASLSATVAALRLEVEQAKLAQPDEATAAQVAALQARLEEREEEREDVVAHLAAVHSMLDPGTLRDSPRPNSSVLSKLEDALTPRKGAGSEVSDLSLEYACTVMGGSDMAGSAAAPAYSTRRGKLEQLRRDVEQHHNRLAEENERLQAEAVAAETALFEEREAAAAAAAAAAAKVAELEVCLAEAKAASEVWKGQQAQASEQLDAMASEVRTLTASRPSERAEVEAMEHKLTAAKKEIGELTSMVAAGLSMEGKLKQANREIVHLKSQLKESVLSKKLAELQAVDQDHRADETVDELAHLKAQLAATESQLAHARADLQVNRELLAAATAADKREGNNNGASYDEMARALEETQAELQRVTARLVTAQASWDGESGGRAGRGGDDVAMDRMAAMEALHRNETAALRAQHELAETALRLEAARWREAAGGTHESVPEKLQVQITALEKAYGEESAALKAQIVALQTRNATSQHAATQMAVREAAAAHSKVVEEVEERCAREVAMAEGRARAAVETARVQAVAARDAAVAEAKASAASAHSSEMNEQRVTFQKELVEARERTTAAEREAARLVEALREAREAAADATAEAKRVRAEGENRALGELAEVEEELQRLRRLVSEGELRVEAAVQAERAQAAAVQLAHAAELERVSKLAEFQTANAREEVAALERTVAALHARRQADAATDGEEAQRAKEEAAAATESLRLKLEAAQREAADGAAAKAAAAQVVAELKAAEWRYEQELQAVRATAAAEAEAALRTHAVQHAALSEEIKSVKSELKLALVQRDNARVKAESATAAMTAAMASREEEAFSTPSESAPDDVDAARADAAKAERTVAGAAAALHKAAGEAHLRQQLANVYDTLGAREVELAALKADLMRMKEEAARWHRWTPQFAPAMLGSAASSPRLPDVWGAGEGGPAPGAAQLKVELTETRRQLEDTRQQLEELRRSLAESRERVWKLEGAELRCQELAEKVATLKQERDEMLQQQAALLERMDANNAADSGHAKRPTHMLTLPPPPNPNRPVTDGGEWALREALAESEAERDELVHQLARARERFDLVNGIVGRSEQQAKRATAEYSAVKEQLASLKAEQKRVLRQQDELVDDLEELELERDELREKLHKAEAQLRAASAGEADGHHPPPVKVTVKGSKAPRSSGHRPSAPKPNGVAYPSSANDSGGDYLDVSSAASSPAPTPPETPGEEASVLRGDDKLTVDWAAISGLVHAN